MEAGKNNWKPEGSTRNMAERELEGISLKHVRLEGQTTDSFDKGRMSSRCL